jgi:hypothetical protein
MAIEQCVVSSAEPVAVPGHEGSRTYRVRECNPARRVDNSVDNSAGPGVIASTLGRLLCIDWDRIIPLNKHAGPHSRSVR